MWSYQYRKSHCGDKTVVRSSYIHNGISYTGKMSSLYWIGAQGIKRHSIDLISENNQPNTWEAFNVWCVSYSVLISWWCREPGHRNNRHGIICINQVHVEYSAASTWKWLINPLRAAFFRDNINIYLYFMSLLHIDMTQVFKILPQVRSGPAYST